MVPSRRAWIYPVPVTVHVCVRLELPRARGRAREPMIPLSRSRHGTTRGITGNGYGHTHVDEKAHAQDSQAEAWALRRWKHMMLDSRASRVHLLIMMMQPAVCRFAYAYFTGIRYHGSRSDGYA